MGSWWWSWGLPWFGLILILILWVAVVAGVCGWGFKQQFGYVLVAGGCDLGLGFWVFVFIWVLGYIILLCENVILMSRIGK